MDMFTYYGQTKKLKEKKYDFFMILAWLCWFKDSYNCEMGMRGQV